jgi:hypothetical protein
MCDVCKYPDKTRERKGALSSMEIAGRGAGAHVEDDEYYDGSPQASGSARPSNFFTKQMKGTTGPARPLEKKDGANSLPFVPRTSTILAPISSFGRGGYRGTALLRSNFKRNTGDSTGPSPVEKEGPAKKARMEDACSSLGLPTGSSIGVFPLLEHEGLTSTG